MSIKINGGTSNVNAEVDPISQALRVALYDVNGIPIGPRRTYDAATFAFTPGFTPTDVFTISGANARLIRITRIRLSGIQNTAGINSWYLLKRSTLNTGGTSTLITNVSRDSTQLAALATVRAYTADPTLGTLVGLIRSGKLLTPANNSLASDTMIWDFDDIQTNPVVLNNINELIAVNFNSAGLPAGLSIHCSVTWTESNMSVRIIGTKSEAKTITSGSLIVTKYNIDDNTQPTRYTYDAATPSFLPGTTPKDVIILTGSSSKIIKVTRIRLTTTQNSNGINSWYLLKRITPNSGGTFIPVTGISRYEKQSNATANFGYYDVDYTIDGILLGLIRSTKLRSPSLTGVLSISEQGVLWDCDDIQSSPIILRGSYESVALNFNGVNRPNGMSVQAHFTWIEE